MLTGIADPPEIIPTPGPTAPVVKVLKNLLKSIVYTGFLLSTMSMLWRMVSASGSIPSRRILISQKGCLWYLIWFIMLYRFVRYYEVSMSAKISSSDICLSME